MLPDEASGALPPPALGVAPWARFVRRQPKARRHGQSTAGRAGGWQQRGGIRLRQGARLGPGRAAC
eukprot:4539111-Lingulodinium_polyedra.AAC.1